MSEWTKARFADLGHIVTGKTPSTSVSEYFGGDIPFVTPSDMDGRKVISKTERYLTQAGVAAVKSAFIPKGSVMVSCIGSDMGKVAIAGHDSVTNQQLNTIVVSETFNADFIYYNLSTRKAELQSLACSGSAQPILNKGHFSELSILIPPLREQRAIAHILGTLDDKIELNRRMNATLEGFAQALFKSWFVVPAQGALPCGWREGTLSDITSFMGGYAFKSKDWIEQGIPVVKIGSVKPGVVDLNDVSYVSDSVAEEAKRFRLAPGDLLIGMTGYVGEVGLVPPTDNPPLLNQRVGKFVLEKRGTSALGFLYCLTRRQEFKAQVEVKSHGTAQANVSADGILSIATVVPPQRLREDFDQLCEPILNQILANYSQSHTLAILRDTLLTKLLSGDVRVNP